MLSGGGDTGVWSSVMDGSPCTIVIELRTNGLDFLNKESSHLIRQFKVIHIVGVHGAHFSYFNQFLILIFSLC